jgi:hypothetical protein
MRPDILTELQEATTFARSPRELERLCGNAHAEITRLRADIQRLDELWSACTVRALAAEALLTTHSIPLPPIPGEVSP